MFDKTEVTKDPNETSTSSNIKESQAGAQTGGAQAGVGSVGQQSGTQSNQTQAGSGTSAQGTVSQEETVTDVGQGEAYLLNMKRLVARELDTDAHLQQQIINNAQRAATAAADFDGQLRSLALNSLVLGQQALQNAVALSNRVNNASVDLDTRIKQNGIGDDSRCRDNAETHDKQMDACGVSERERTVRGGDAGDVIRWAALADNPVLQDIVTAAAAEAAARVIASQSAK